MKSKINFLNLKKLTTADYEKIRDLPVSLLFRYSLKLIRTYPSSKRDDLRESMILDYHDNKKFTDENEIDSALYQARGFLHHLITYDMIMKEMTREDTNKFYHKFDLGVNHTQIVDQNKEDSKTNKKNKKEFEYFD